ncbi:MAG: EFR1 family ferrodoxin [Sphaerochaetaceae bacterium]
MSSLLTYFSGSGNSKAVSSDLASLLEINEHCFIGKLFENPQLLEDKSIIGLVTPIYFNGVPLLVEKFIKEILSQYVKQIEYLFVILVHGGLPLYGASVINRLLSEIGCAASYIGSVKTINTYIPFFMIPKTVDYNKSAKQILKIGSHLRDEEIKVNSNYPPNRFFYDWWREFMSKVNEKDRNFVVTDECDGCKICVEKCPVKNISIKDNRPVYNHRCNYCFACYHHCPQKAIRLKKRPLLGYSWYTPQDSFITKRQYNGN